MAFLGANIGNIVVIIILVSLSAFFSSSETAFASVNRIRVKNRANMGDKRAK
ncbi:MAG: CNNM domain-containing protein, partial [Oscillospiraceae bacterium]